MKKNLYECKREIVEVDEENKAINKIVFSRSRKEKSKGGC